MSDSEPIWKEGGERWGESREYECRLCEVSIRVREGLRARASVRVTVRDRVRIILRVSEYESDSEIDSKRE